MLVRFGARSLVLQALIGSLALASLTGCGGSGRGEQAGDVAEMHAIAAALATSNQYAAVKQTAPVVTVGARQITRAMLQRWMEVGTNARQKVPEPPKYTACVARLRKAQDPGENRQDLLRAECQRRYQALMSPALTALVDRLWVVGEASELGMQIDRAGVEHALATQMKDPTFKHTLQQSGQTLSDVRLSLGYNQLTDRIYKSVNATAPRATSSQLKRYYNEHKARFFHHQEERDLHIVRVTSKAAAVKALGELKSGRSFASVVKHVAVNQPIGAVDGLFLGLTPERFVELDLAHAIFRAHPREVIGPVKISLGYYIFEVTKIHAPHQGTLAEAEPSLRKELPGLLREEHLDSFVTAFRKKWMARTHCRAGFVVEGCRQFKGSPVAEKNPSEL
jgi:foldase protein PrsA